MNRLVYFVVSLPLLLLFLSGAEAGPACARRSQGSDDCLSLCKSKWGWPGFVMGTDPWGSVITATKTSTDALGAVVTQACRVRPSGAISNASSSSSSSSSSVAASTITASSESVTAPANVIVSASVSSVISAPSSPSLSLLSLTTLHSTAVSSSHSSSIEKPTGFASSHSLSISIVEPKPTTTPHTTTVVHVTSTSSATHTTPHTTSTQPPPETIVVKSTPTPSSKAAAPPPSSTPEASTGGTSQSDIDAYLSAHNTVRAQHGAQPLTWSNNLAAAAQKWANGCIFQHSGGTLGPFGENLAAGTGSSYGIAAAVKSWTDEVSEYDASNPQPSHFTQVVWKASTQVGCAVQSCEGIFAASFGPAKYFVCEYSPQGNVIGEFPQNVQV